MFLALTDLVLRRPWWTIAIALAVTAGVGSGMHRLYADTDVTHDLPQRIEAKRLYDRIDELFPAKEMIVVGVQGDALFTAGGVARLDRLTRRVEALPEIQSVLSPTSARLIAATEDRIDIHPAGEPLPTNDAEALELRARLLDQPMLAEALLDADDPGVVALMAFVKAGLREADAAEKVIAIADDPAASEGLTLQVTGRAAATYWAKLLMARDMGMLSSAALTIVLLLLIIAFRSLRGLLLPLAVVMASVVCTLGLMGYLGQPLTHSTEILPILLIAIGVADGIHILKGYFARAREVEDRRVVVRRTMEDLNRPVVLTSITTAVGFLALNTSGIESIMWLGALTAFGVMVAMVFSITFLPAVLSLLSLPRRVGSAGARGRFLTIEAVAARYGRFLVERRAAVMVAIIAVVGGASAGASRVVSEFSNLSNFRDDHPFRVATESVNESFACASTLTVVVETGEPDGIKDPAVLRRIDALEAHLRRQPHVGSVHSLTGYIKQMHRVLHGGDSSYYRIPAHRERQTALDLVEEDGLEVEREVEIEVSGREVVAQYLALYEMSGKPGDLANAVTYDYSTARVNVMVDSDRASALTDLSGSVRRFLETELAGSRAELTGMAELMRAVNELVVSGQAWSIAMSLVLVLAVTSIVFRSAVLGAFATLPLFFSLFLNFGTMGWGGIPLNIMTMATSSVAVGVGIDYAIHFVHRYQQERRHVGYGEAVVRTLRASGVAIFLNALTVAAGFFALFLSEFRGVSHMGLLIALTMVTSAFAALTILPVLFVTLRPRAFGGHDQEVTR